MEEKFFAHCLYIAELRRVKFGTRNFKIQLLELRYMKRRKLVKLVKFVVLYSFRLLNYIYFCPSSLSFQCLSPSLAFLFILFLSLT